MAVKVAGAATALASQVVIARVLSVPQYGVYTFVMAWITLIALLAPLGADKASVRFIPAYLVQSRNDDVRRYLRWAFTQGVIVSVAVAAIAASAVWVWRHSLPAGVMAPLLMATVMVPINAVAHIATEVVRAFRKVVLSEIPNMVLRPIVVGASAWFAVGTFNVPAVAESIVILSVFGGLLSVLLLWLFIRAVLRTPSVAVRSTEVLEPQASADRSEWVRASLALLVVLVGNFILGRTDILMLGMLIGPEESGLYNAASRIATTAGFPLIAIASILTPMISRSYSSGRIDELQAVLTFGAWLSLGASVAVGAATVLLAKPLLGLFGSAYQSEVMTLRILVVGQVVSSLAGAVGYLLAVTGGQRFLAGMTSAAAAVNIILNVFLIPPLGAAGAAIATAVTLSLYNLVLAGVAVRDTGVNPTIFSRRMRA